jgi:hypothetical protein
MWIETGTPEDHPSVLPLDTSATPGVVAPTPRYPSGTEQGGALTNTAGVDFTGQIASAMTAGMGADSDRRTVYAASMAPFGASAGDLMDLPAVPDNTLPAAASYGYPFAGMEPTPAAAGWDYSAELPG